jgi:hypothetical protein
MKKYTTVFLAAASALVVAALRGPQPNTAPIEEAQEKKDQIEDTMGWLISKATLNSDATDPAVAHAVDLRAFFHDHFAPAVGVIGEDGTFTVHNMEACSEEPCYPFVVTGVLPGITRKWFVEWRQKPALGIFVYTDFNPAEGFGGLKAFHEVMHAWQKFTGQHDVPAEIAHITPDTRLPWEDEVYGWLSTFVDTVSGGIYQPFIDGIATEVIRNEREVISPNVIAYTHFPRQLYTIAGMGYPSRWSKSEMLDLATIDLNRAIIVQTSGTPEEVAVRRATLLAYYALESRTPEVKEFWAEMLSDN